VKQVFDGTQHGSRLDRKSLSALTYCGIICPLRRDHGLTAVRQNQDQIQSAVAMDLAENIERSRFKWMMSANNRDPLKKVLMMGSVSPFPSITSTRHG
jgi:hypothetical protein